MKFSSCKNGDGLEKEVVEGIPGREEEGSMG